MIAFIINSTGLTLIMGAKSHTIRRDHANYAAIVAELNGAKDEATLTRLVDIPATINNFTGGKVAVVNGELTFNGDVVQTGLAKRILALISEGNDGLAAPLIKFLENLMNNPSHRAVQGLYEWLEKSDLPITPDGKFIAWKIVGPDFKDLYSRTFDNSPGKVVEVPRNQVDEDPDRTCSYGLHFCSSGYLPHYGRSEGNRVMMVAVDPSDVVAFPRDYNTAKGRACKYTVLSEVNREVAPTMFEGQSGVYVPEKVKPSIVSMAVNARGAFTFETADNQSIVTRVPALADYDYTVLDDGRVQVLPSGRKLNI